MLRDALLPIGAGIVVGVGGTLAAAGVIESLLFQTAPRDPVTLAGVAATLAITGCLAALGPALRAAHIDPVASLRAE
jgi:putative ABC transport system permease protein